VTGPRRVRGTARPDPLRARLAGPWRVAVADGSMRPSIEPGDWLLVDPTVARWPRRGSIVVFREPGSDVLAIKRVAARPGDWIPFADGRLRLGEDEAWLLSDASDTALEAAGFGPAVDSRRYGPVPVEALVGRAWVRYWPGRSVGRLPAAWR
jgi:signal peptidase I